ncbi:NAD-dependent epimerase/dehydratase family protein [Acaryochloris sp. IP29b_bin.137]|uniref:NAD-dependent epimerase/dehydratase family protein n=1 Tax=Acaryochloris sp. IP29b_bin.137 TaxID=2969217 RepID=UPI00260C790D|nr:NAD-dependent epimerase/dehydratase family protein [Acaryochloris sp. IP29b_bin.137]
MNILITGANGFVGSALCQATWPANTLVLAAVRSEDAISACPSHVKPLVIHSLFDLVQRTDILSQIDCVIHLAARVHQKTETFADSLPAFLELNTFATAELAKAAVKAKVKRFIYLSSIKVFGSTSTEQHSFNELDPLTPDDPYGYSKQQAERLLSVIADNTDLEVVILRPPLVYGPGVKANFLQLLKAVQAGIPLPLAQVNNCRSLLFVGNLIDAILTCVTHPSAANQIFIVSDGEDISTSDLLNRTGLALNRPTPLFPLPLSWLKVLGYCTGRTSQVDRLLSSFSTDSGKIRKMLDWQPPFTLEQGLLATVTWYLQSQQR